MTERIACATSALAAVLYARSLKRQIARHGDREEDPEDQQHDRQLDEREAFLTCEAPLDALDEAGGDGWSAFTVLLSD